MSPINPYEPPESEPYYTLWTSKADMDVQRNLLLNFLQERELNQVFLEWLRLRAPDLGPVDDESFT